MMATDTSAIMAILMDEDEGPAFSSAMWNDGEVLVSTATAVELMIVAMGKDESQTNPHAIIPPSTHPIPGRFVP